MDSTALLLTLPFATAVIAFSAWKRYYVGRRPISRGVKVIWIAVVAWSSLPLLGYCGLYWLFELGGHLGD